MEQISGGWSDDEFDDANINSSFFDDGHDAAAAFRDEPDLLERRGGDGRQAAPEPHRHQPADSGPPDATGDAAEPHATYRVERGSLDHDDWHDDNPDQSTPQNSHQGQATDNDRLALVGVINDDNSIRVQVLATPPPKPPRLPPLAPTSSLSLTIPGSSPVASLAAGSPTHDGTRTKASASTTQHPTTDEETMTKLQEASLEKREERAELMHSLTTKIALVTSQVVHENLQREASLRDLHGRLGQSLEEAMDRMALRQDVLHSCVEQMHQLEVQLTRMDARMTKSLHAETCQHLHDLLGALQQRADDAASSHRRRAENCLGADSAAFRTMDRMAGDLRRHWLEERSSRTSAIELAEYQIQERDWDPSVARQYLDHIQELRDQIRHERVERLRSDATVKDRIVRATTSLKRAMLHLAVDPPTDEVDDSIAEVDDEGEEDEQGLVARGDFLDV